MNQVIMCTHLTILQDSHIDITDGRKLNKKFCEDLISYFPFPTTSKSSSVIACVYVAAETCLPSRCLVTMGDTKTAR
jgi:hypothetical protein